MKKASNFTKHPHTRYVMRLQNENLAHFQNSQSRAGRKGSFGFAPSFSVGNGPGQLRFFLSPQFGCPGRENTETNHASERTMIRTEETYGIFDHLLGIGLLQHLVVAISRTNYHVTEHEKRYRDCILATKFARHLLFSVRSHRTYEWPSNVYIRCFFCDGAFPGEHLNLFSELTKKSSNDYKSCFRKIEMNPSIPDHSLDAEKLTKWFDNLAHRFLILQLL